MMGESSSKVKPSVLFWRVLCRVRDSGSRGHSHRTSECQRDKSLQIRCLFTIYYYVILNTNQLL